MQKSKLGKNILRHWQLYLFLLVPVLYILIFSYVPMAGLQIAFKKYNAQTGIWGSPWIGFKNFETFFKSYQFVRVLKNTLVLSFYSIFVGFPIPIFFALLLNTLNSNRIKKTIQTITYMPHFISTVVIVGMLVQIFNTRIGLYSVIYGFFNNSGQSVDLLSSASAFPHMYVWSGIWQTFGWNSIVYTAALASVSMELHEAAEIDGASRFQRIIYIDLPSIMPTATIMLIMRMGHVMSIGFEKVYLMQNSLNLRASEVISTYVYKVGLSAEGKMNFSYSTSIGLFNSIINLILICSVNFLAKKMSDTSLW